MKKEEVGSLISQAEAFIELEVYSQEDMAFQEVAIAIYDRSGAMLINLTTLRKSIILKSKAKKPLLTYFHIISLPLLSGMYEIGVYLKDKSGKYELNLRHSQSLEVIEETTSRHEIKPNNDGCIFCPYNIE